MQSIGSLPRSARAWVAFGLISAISLAALAPAHAASSPATIALSAGQYVSTQTQSNVIVTVIRSGSLARRASVSIRTSNGSAIAGSNYTKVSASLSWAAGDGQPKTVPIALAAQPVFSGSKTFQVSLQNVSGATLGQPASAQIVINGAGEQSAPLSISGTPGNSVTVGSSYMFQPTTTAPSGATVAYSVVNKPAWASFSTVNGALSGTPASSAVGTTTNIVISASDATSTAALPAFSLTVNAAAAPPPAGGGSTATRPSYNNGTGFFVLNGALYDPNGNSFRIRGVNRVHWDSNSSAGMALSGANAVRTFIDFTQPVANNINLIQTQNIANGQVPVVTYAGIGSGETLTSCSTDPATLSAAMSAWTAQASQWATLNKYLIINIANEWGPANSSVWENAYINAVTTLRGAGYTGPLLIDSGACGQDDADLLQYSGAVFNSDPERNVIFSVHLYGSTNDYSAAIQSITKGNPTVITLASNSPTHPFAPGYNGSNNNWSGISAYQISGVAGMTQINGMQPSVANVGGVPGAWTVTLSVDSSSWGDYSGGGTVVDYDGNYALRIARLAALSQQTGAVYVIGEFGPGDNIGPSPTMVTPAEILTAAEANGIGWIPWAWDDNNLAGGMSNNSWFSMTCSGPGIYTQPADLTSYGQDVVLNPSYGIQALAKRASIF
jgi:mannan endo-1,4-beta-mannosidase